ncbi:CBFD_NFYB_HMF domain-containing protein [Psidium guajava]|nr:CBFD_NFYB_HMF domain-containing protein [Psidium guajava]
MEEEIESYHGNVPNVVPRRRSSSPESPCLKTSHHHSNKEQDRFLPIANVGRIMKKVLPGNGKISKDAKETVQECVSEFISFVTGEASDKCQREKRKTINGDDIIWAVTTLGFEDYVVPLKKYLNKYREIEGEKLNVPKQQQRSCSSSDQQQPQQQQQHRMHQPPFDPQIQDHSASMGFANNDNNSSNGFCSPASILSQPRAFGGANHQPLISLPFSPNPIQKQLQHQDQADSLGQW